MARTHGWKALQLWRHTCQRTSRGCKHCLNSVVGRQGCYEARARRVLKLLKHMGSRVGDFLSQPKRSTRPPPATSMGFVPGSQQSIESMHPVTHVKTAYRIGDHVYVSCKGESGPQTMDIKIRFAGQPAVKLQWLYTPGIEIPMQDHYGEKELSQSKHHDIVPDRSLNGKCDVKYDVAEYNDVLRGHLRRTTPGIQDIVVASPSVLMGACQQTCKGHSNKCDQSLHPGEGDESGLRTSIQSRQDYAQMLKM